MKNDEGGPEARVPCSFCGATRNDDGACSFVDCPSPLGDLKMERAFQDLLLFGRARVSRDEEP